MNSLISKYYGESRYLEAKRIENFREVARWFETPSYFKPMEKGYPKAEIGRCGCGSRGKWYEFIVHILP